MIRYFENEDKQGILRLASEYHGDKFDTDTFAAMFDSMAKGNEIVKGISVLHAGEYLGYCIIYIENNTVIVNQIYIKPAFQNKKVAPQVFDFIEAEYPGYKYKAKCPADNTLAIKVFSQRGYEIITA